MNGNFKQCPNGHYYSATLSQCPYCPQPGGAPSGQNKPTADSTMNSAATAQFLPTGDNANDDSGRTIDMSNVAGVPGVSATSAETIDPAMPVPEPVSAPMSNRTMVLEEEVDAESGQVQAEFVRSRRKLVGWLVSYTLDEMGVDFKLYEGRNLIGRNMSNQITIQDPTVSGEHALILFRAGKFSIKDQQSTQGTFVNDKDIELDPVYLQDGDMIRFGKTILRFRSAL